MPQLESSEGTGIWFTRALSPSESLQSRNLCSAVSIVSPAFCDYVSLICPYSLFTDLVFRRIHERLGVAPYCVSEPTPARALVTKPTQIITMTIARIATTMYGITLSWGVCITGGRPT